MTFRLSPSSIGIMRDCERCFWLRFNRNVHRPRGIFPTLPGGIDEVLKGHFDRFREKGELPPELARSGFKGKLLDDQLLIDEWREDGIKAEVPELGVSLLGKIDDVLVDEDGKTRIKERYVVAAPLSGQLARITLKPGDVVRMEMDGLGVLENRVEHDRA